MQQNKQDTLFYNFSADTTAKPASVKHPRREGSPKNTASRKKEIVQPKAQDDDGVYYELDENDQLVRMEPQQQPAGSSGNSENSRSEAGAATFSRQPGGNAAVVVNINQSGR